MIRQECYGGQRGLCSVLPTWKVKTPDYTDTDRSWTHTCVSHLNFLLNETCGGEQNVLMEIQRTRTDE